MTAFNVFPSTTRTSARNSGTGIAHGVYAETSRRLHRRGSELFGLGWLPVRRPNSSRRVRLESPGILYAVGDLHGCLELYDRAEDWILEDAQRLGRPPTVVILGDFVDRGARTAQLIDRLCGPFPEGVRYCLCGNHEAAFLEFIGHPTSLHRWLSYGGEETLASYGIVGVDHFRRGRLEQYIAAHVPDEHVSFLRSLFLSVETRHDFFCHAGVKPGVSLSRQSDHDLLWYRDDMKDDYREFPKRIVHGHQIVEAPFITPHRVNLDLGAYVTGRIAILRCDTDAPEQVAIVTEKGVMLERVRH